MSFYPEPPSFDDSPNVDLYVSHKIVQSREWTDDEPDTLSIRVERCEGDGVALVSFTCSSTWLDAATVRDEVVPWLLDCCAKADAINCGE
jgi:hypothetical protein